MQKRPMTLSVPFMHQTDEESPLSITERPAEEDSNEKLPDMKSFESLASLEEQEYGTYGTLNDSKESKENEYDMMTILRKTERTDKEALYLYNQIKDFRFFTQFIENIDEHERMQAVTYICKKLEYRAYEMGEVIIKQGSFSDGKVYITLSGELIVMVNSLTTSVPMPASSRGEITERREPEKKEAPKEDQKEHILEIGQLSPEKSMNNASPTLESKPTLNLDSVFMHYNTRNPTTVTKMRSEPRSPKKGFVISTSHIPDQEDGNKEIEQSPATQQQVASTLADIPSSMQRVIVIPAARPSIDFDNLATLNTLRKDKIEEPMMASIPEIKLKQSDKSKGKKMEKLKEKEKDQEKEKNNEKLAVDYDYDFMVRTYGIVVNKLYRGAYFGERALYKKHRRTATIIANSPVELLKLGIDDFQYVITEFNKTKKQMLQFLRDIFPNLDKVQTPILLENLSYTYDIRNCTYHNLIMSEGARGEDFYVIYEGKCELIKTLVYDRTDNLSPNMAETKSLYRMRKTCKEQITVMTLEKGMIFGEEIIFNADPIYEYTVRISSEKARLMSFKKQKFLYKCPKVVLQGLSDVYTNKKQRIHRILLDRLEKKGTKASAEILEEVKPVIAFPTTMTTYGPDLHKKRGESLQAVAQSKKLLLDTMLPSFPILPKTQSSLDEKGSPSRLIKLLQTEVPPKSPKSGRFDGIFSPRDIESRKNHARNHSQDIRIQHPPKTPLSPENVLTKSSGTSPIRGTHSPIPKMRGLSDALGNYFEKLKSRNDIEQKGPESYTNNIDNFNFNFGRTDKNMDRKYRAYQAKQGMLKKPHGSIDLSKNNSLADFLTHKLREKNYMKEIPQGPLSLNSSPRFKQNSYNMQAFGSVFLEAGQSELANSKVQEVQTTRRVDVRKLTFMQDLNAEGVRGSRQLSPVFQHVPMKKQAREAIKPLFIKKELVMEDISSKKLFSPTKKSPSSILSPSIVRMDINYTSGLSTRTPREPKGI